MLLSRSMYPVCLLYTSYIFDLQNNTFEISQSAVKRFNMSKNVLTDAANEVMKVVYEEDRRICLLYTSRCV